MRFLACLASAMVRHTTSPCAGTRESVSAAFATFFGTYCLIFCVVQCFNCLNGLRAHVVPSRRRCHLYWCLMLAAAAWDFWCCYCVRRCSAAAVGTGKALVLFSVRWKPAHSPTHPLTRVNWVMVHAVPSYGYRFGLLHCLFLGGCSTVG